MIEFRNLTDDKYHIVTETKGQFSVIEHRTDLSVDPESAVQEFYMKEMNLRRKQLMINMDGKTGATVQAGSMQWLTGDIKATTGVKGVGDLFGKAIKGAASNESAIKPEYQGTGVLMLEPTYKYILLENVADWEGGLVLEDGMFLACDSTIKQKIQGRSNISSAFLGNEGFFNLKLVGKGICALESGVPRSEIVEIRLKDDVLKIDGSFAICWSGDLEFTVKRAGKTLLGSFASGEGFVNTFKGTGRVWINPLMPTITPEEVKAKKNNMASEQDSRDVLEEEVEE